MVNKRGSGKKGQKEQNQTRYMESFRLRTIERMSFRNIGVALSISHTQVVKDVLKAVNEIKTTQVERIEIQREIENQKLNIIEEIIFLNIESTRDADQEEAKKGWIDTYLKLSKRRSELNGIDAPQRIDTKMSFEKEIEKRYENYTDDEVIAEAIKKLDSFRPPQQIEGKRE